MKQTAQSEDALPEDTPPDDTKTELPEPTPAVPWQFNLSSMFFVTLNVGMVLAYVRAYQPDRVADLIGVFVAAVVVGGMAGSVKRRFAEPLYWSVLLACFAVVSVVDRVVFEPHGCFAWGLVGALVGSLVATLPRKCVLKAMLLSAIAATATILAFAVESFALGNGISAIYDAIVAPIVGALSASFIEGVYWIEARYAIRRVWLTTVLLALVIGANMFEHWMGWNL